MNEWGIALIAAGAAILGSAVTGFFAWKAGHRQAAAAETAGQAQAAALISTVQATLDEQRRARADERRRETYAAFLTAADQWQKERPIGDGKEVFAAFGLIEIEGPHEVIVAAGLYQQAVHRFVHAEIRHMNDVLTSRTAYVHTVHEVLNEG
ncbi:hypothetical protein AMK27_38165 [Streptomyces sp. CB02009]|uniref:hypothetical protein n=1 Tax=Streptomyces sp. CB02009 TaxID=1703938 RepID=UPI00093CA0E0|nr:hypothetical protein [Streptomyces sp. CB02009]OKJ48656.1 hypothetical protein AMK27_38165 [Streptomyces sp. CB02009]